MMLRCNIEPYGVFYLKEHCYEPYGEIHTEVWVSVRLSIAQLFIVQLFIAMEERMIRITSAAGFGEVIRSRRKELHYTQGFLSEFSGLSVSFISDLENGKKTAELEKAIYLANLLGLDLCLEGREHGS